MIDDIKLSDYDDQFKEMNLEIKGDTTYFTPIKEISGEIKEKYQKDKIYFKKMNGNRWRCSGQDSDKRKKAIISIQQLNLTDNQLEEYDFQSEDDDNDEVLARMMNKMQKATAKPTPTPQPTAIPAIPIQSEQKPPETKSQNKNENQKRPQQNRQDYHSNQNNNQRPPRTNTNPNYQNHNRNNQKYQNQRPNSQRKEQSVQPPRESNIPAQGNQPIQQNPNQAKPEGQIRPNMNNRGGYRGRGIGRGRGRGRGSYHNRGRAQNMNRPPIRPVHSIIDEEPSDRTNSRNQQQQRNNSRRNDKTRGPKYDHPHVDHMNNQIQQQPIQTNHQFRSEIEFTTELKHKLMLMSNAVNMNTQESVLKETPWFNLSMLYSQFDDRDLKNSYPMNVPYLLIDFLIESFATDQPIEIQHKEHKGIQDRILHLDIPFSIPMKFSYNDEKVRIEFFDLFELTRKKVFPNSEILDICNNVLTAFSERQVLCVHFDQIDSNFDFSEFTRLANELDFVYIYSTPIPNEEDESISFDLKIMEYDWSQNKESQIVKALNALFTSFSIHECAKCGLLYSPTDGSICYKTVHEGRQIPFDSGEMEEIGLDEDNNPVTYVNYECCGEVPINEPGCKPTNEVNGNHESYETISKLSIETEPMYKS